MFRPLNLFIALRYLKAKRRNHFISFISLVSILGITLGVTVLITVLSVMNGFDQQIRDKIFGVARQLSIISINGRLDDWQSIAKQVQKNPDVKEIAPFIDGQGVLTSKEGGVTAIAIVGIAPHYEAAISSLAKKMIAGKLSDLKAGEFGIILGDKLAASLGVTVGDKVVLMIPQATLTPAALMPRFKRFTVKGIFSIGSGFGGYDAQIAMINMTDAQKLFQLGNGVTGIRLKLSDLYLAPYLSQVFEKTLPEDVQITNWTEQFGNFFDAIKLEKTMMFIILLLIVAVATFNLVSTLVMVVNDKRADIAILRTLGATPSNILWIFIFQGFIVGLFGTLLGLMGGLLLANNATAIVNFIEHVFHVNLFSGGIYFVDYLPSKVEANDVIQVCLIALILSLLATLYPAWRAARTQPAEALRYE